MKIRLFLLFALAVSAAFAVPTLPPPCPVPEPATPSEYINRADFLAFLQVNSSLARQWADFLRLTGDEEMAVRAEGISSASDWLFVMLTDPAGSWETQFGTPPPALEPAPAAVTIPETPAPRKPNVPDCNLPLPTVSSAPAMKSPKTPQVKGGKRLARPARSPRR